MGVLVDLVDRASAFVCMESDGRTQAQVAAHWDQMTRRPGPPRARWWQVPEVVAHVNRLVGGKAEPGASRGLERRLRARLAQRGGPTSFRRAVSVGGGAGQKEMALLRSGMVEAFDVYELSTERIEVGRRKAEELGLSDRLKFHRKDAFEADTRGRYDMVHWNNALHHMFDVDAAVDWSWHALQMGGVFYMDDFVGPSRFQWSDLSLSIASVVRAHLPERYLRDPRKPGCMLPSRLHRPDPEALMKSDPSEAADSDRILDAVTDRFPGADIVRTGGVIYHLALSEVLANIHPEDEGDRMALDLLLGFDLCCLSIPGLETHYATCIAFKESDGPPAILRRGTRMVRAAKRRTERGTAALKPRVKRLVRRIRRALQR